MKSGEKGRVQGCFVLKIYERVKTVRERDTERHGRDRKTKNNEPNPPNLNKNYTKLVVLKECVNT